MIIKQIAKKILETRPEFVVPSALSIVRNEPRYLACAVMNQFPRLQVVPDEHSLISLVFYDDGVRAKGFLESVVYE